MSVNWGSKSACAGCGQLRIDHQVDALQLTLPHWLCKACHGYGWEEQHCFWAPVPTVLIPPELTLQKVIRTKGFQGGMFFAQTGHSYLVRRKGKFIRISGILADNPGKIWLLLHLVTSTLTTLYPVETGEKSIETGLPELTALIILPWMRLPPNNPYQLALQILGLRLPAESWQFMSD